MTFSSFGKCPVCHRSDSLEETFLGRELFQSASVGIGTKEFEAWAIKEGFSLEKTEHGYTSSATRNAWFGWKVAISMKG